MRRTPGLLSILLIAIPMTFAQAQGPRCEDVDDLILLSLQSSHREMGRQQAELLGRDQRTVFDYRFAAFRHLVAEAGVGGWFFSHGFMPLAASLVTARVVA